MPLQHVRSGYVSVKQLRRLQAAASRLYEAPLWIDDTGGGDYGRVEAALRRFIAEHGDLDLAVLDYLGLMTSGRRHQTRREEVAWMSRNFKILAGELRLAVMALSQITRESTKRSDSRPRLEDLAESGATEADADQVVFIHRPEYYEPMNEELKGKAVLIVAKYRDGETGDVPLLWSGPLMTFKPEPVTAWADPFG